MTLLSPLDALGPAFRRTREVLGIPFRLGFFLKIALIAALTQPSFYSASITYPIDGLQFGVGAHAGHHSTLMPEAGGSHFAASPGLAAFGLATLIAAVVIGVAVWVLLCYLYCRLRFTLFDLVVYKRGLVGKAWSGYGRQSWRYFGLVVLVSLGFMVVALIVLGPAVLNLVRVFKPLVVSSRVASNPAVDPFRIFGAMLPFLAGMLALVVLWAVVDALMQDFLLPPMAIDDAPLESAFGRLFALLKTNFGSVIIYLLLRFAVGIGLTWIPMLVFFLVLVVAGLALFGVGTLVYHALWASTAGQVICVALAILVGLIALVIYFLAVVSIYGTAAVFKQSYAAYFFGGRYTALGDRLEPPSPVSIERSEPPRLFPSVPQPVIPPFEDAPPVW
jgi:hypothetical protein